MSILISLLLSILGIHGGGGAAGNAIFPASGHAIPNIGGGPVGRKKDGPILRRRIGGGPVG